MTDQKTDASSRSQADAGLVPLDEVLCTGELNRRPARAPDFEKENRALVALAQSLADPPRSVLQTLASTLLEAFDVGSAGVSLLTNDGKRFDWPAIAGMWKPYTGGGAPRNFSPCGDVLDCNAPLLFTHPERRYSYLLPVMPLAQECLLVPFRANGNTVGTIWLVAHDERRKFDAEDLRQLESLGRFASAAYQAARSLDAALERSGVELDLEEQLRQSRTGRKQAEDAVRESEAINRSVVESSPDCIKILGLNGDLLFMLSGAQVLGIEDIKPFLKKSWFDFWHGQDSLAAQAAVAAAAAGRKEEFVGFFPTPQGEAKWWSVRVSPILGANGLPERLLAVSRNVTEQRRREMNLEFLASFSHDLMHWTNVQEMMQSVGAKVGAHLQLSLCAFAEIDETAQEVVINHDWHRDDVPGLAGTYCLADFVEQEFIRIARAGEVIVVRDVALDPRTDPSKFATLKISSFLCVPLVRDRLWRFAMCLYKSEAHEWREDQIELARELTARIWTRLERLRAEAAVRNSEQRYRTLFESIDEGFCIIEKVESEAEAPLDFIYIEANEAFAVQSGVRDVVGKTIRQVVPDESEEWLITYDTVLRTGESIKFEQGLVSQGRVLELYALPVQDETRRRVAVIFKDITGRKRAEEALRQRTAQFEALFNDAPLGVYLIDADFRIRHVNPAALPAFENTPALIGRDFAEVMHILWPETRADEFIKQFRHTLETGESRHVPELIQQRADRQTTDYYEWQINRIPLPDDRHGVVCYFRDISRRVLAQQQLRASEERYRSLFNSMDEGYCIVEMIFDEHNKPVDYRFLEMNPAFTKLTGMPDAVGKRMRELAPDHEAHWFETYGNVALTGEAIRFVNEAKALQNRWFDVYAFKVGGTDSQKVAIVFTNITERRKSDAALRRSEERFRALFDWGPIAMYSCDSAGVIQEYNQGAVKLWKGEPKFGDTDEQFRSSFKTYLPNGTLMPFSKSAMTRVLKSEMPAMHDLEVDVERPDGSRITVVVNVVPLKDDQGRVNGAITCFYDITERSRLEHKLQQQAEALTDLDRRKDEFLAMLSHELRNPLAPLTNAVHMLRLQKNEDPVQRQARSVIERQVAQLKHLVDDLLEISRITTGRVQLRRERIALGGIVERAIETAQPLVEQRRHELTVSLPPQPLWLHADAARLEQVVVNLLTNAAKYTDDGGRIVVDVRQEGDEAVLRVRDTGIGIAAELLPHIFDLFTQAERSLDRSQGGLGIGLCLVQRLVDLHGGTVAASSVLGQGSEFVVRLPAMPMHLLQLPSPSPSIETAQPPGNGCRVLVVDDNVDAAQSLSDLLEATGHVVRMAHDGLDALEVLQDFRPDLVLLDIGLPGLTGLEVAKRIRELPERGDIVLAAMTGYGQDTDRQRSKDAGFDYHLVKPADFGAVEKILETVSRIRNR